jgi:hypothetical protein
MLLVSTEEVCAIATVCFVVVFQGVSNTVFYYCIIQSIAA